MRASTGESVMTDTASWSVTGATTRNRRPAILGLRGPGAVAIVALGLIAIAVVVGPLLWRIHYAVTDFSASAQGPSARHPFGTDLFGRDLLARLMVGTRVSIVIALSSQLVAVGIGLVLGLFAGTGRRCSDSIVIRSI